ncbi:MAG: VOC family protein [Pseudomonadota bacterium]
MADRAFTNVLCTDLPKSVAFYTALLGLTEHFTSDWFVILTDPDRPGFELGLLTQTSPITPAQALGPAQGVLLTFVVADCDQAHRKATELGADVLEPPQDMFYGQRRMILRDPDGVLLDISAPTAPAPGA